MRLYRPGVFVFAIFGAAAGCATGTPAGQDKPDAKVITVADAPIGTPDSPVGTPDAKLGTPDAPPAQPVTITLSQATSTSIVALNSVSCNAANVTAENSYYRAFPLSDFGITGPFTVQSVSYAVESATAEIGTSQGVQVRVYNYTGTAGAATLDTASMTQLGGVASTVPNTTTGTMITANVAATVPAGGTVVAEVFVPDGDPDGDTFGNAFFIGSNASGESRPGYIRAPDCGATVPTSFASLGLTTTVDIVISVTGTYIP